MTVLHRHRRPETGPTPSEMMQAAGEGIAREVRRGRYRTARRTLTDAVGQNCSLVTAATLLGVIDYAQVQPLAAVFAGVVATIAVKVLATRAERVAHSIFDTPGGRTLAAKLLGELGSGPVAMQKDAAWIVFDSPDSLPRVMSEEDYLAHRMNVPNLLEVDASESNVIVTRRTYGEADSVLTGRPAVELYDRSGAPGPTEWLIRGAKANKEAVKLARALAGPEPTYEEEAFAPRI